MSTRTSSSESTSSESTNVITRCDSTILKVFNSYIKHFDIRCQRGGGLRAGDFKYIKRKRAKIREDIIIIQKIIKIILSDNSHFITRRLIRSKLNKLKKNIMNTPMRVMDKKLGHLHITPLILIALYGGKSIKDIEQRLKHTIYAGGDINGICNFNKRIYAMGDTSSICTFNKQKQNALICVSRSDINCLYSIEPLINAGININLQDVHGKTSLHYFLENKNFQKHIQYILNLLINAGVDVNLKTNCGYTALMIFCAKYKRYKNIKDCVKILINAGADPNIRNKQGNNALRYLCCRLNFNENIKDCVKILINAGADPNIRNKKGNTALRYLCKRVKSTHIENITKCIKILIKSGADPDIKNKSKTTILIYLCKRTRLSENVNFIKILIKAKSDLDIKDNYGNTALFYLCKRKVFNEHVKECVNILIEAGADLDIRNKKGNTVLIEVINYNLTTSVIDYVKLFKDGGININLKNKSKESAMTILNNIKNDENKGSFTYRSKHKLCCVCT